MLDAGDPTAGGVQFFAVHGDRMTFFRPRDFDPVTSRVWHGELVSGQLARGPGGKDVLLPGKQVGRNDGRPWIPPQSNRTRTSSR